MELDATNRQWELVSEHKELMKLCDLAEASGLGLNTMHVLIKTGDRVEDLMQGGPSWTDKLLKTASYFAAFSEVGPWKTLF